jgi:hypothetical protein
MKTQAIVMRKMCAASNPECSPYRKYVSGKVTLAPEVMVGCVMDDSPIFIFISSSWPCATATDASPSSIALVKVTSFGDGDRIGVVGRSLDVKREFPRWSERGVRNRIGVWNFKKGYICSQVTGEEQDDYYGEQ